MDLAVLADHIVKLKEREKDKYVDPRWELEKKTVEDKIDVYTNCNWYCWYSRQRVNKGTGGLGNKGTSGDHPSYSIIEIGQNSEKCPGDLRRLAVSQS